MDNLTHTLCALALARCRPLIRAPLAVHALVLAANFPDLDVAPRLIQGAVGYLEYHRGITHSLCGIVVEAVLLVAVFRGFLRLRGGEVPAFFARDGLLPPVAVGLVSHFVLDYVISYGIRPWLPFSATWYYGDLVFVVDPWLWLLFGGIAAACGATSPRAEKWWSFGAAATSAIVLFAPLEKTSLPLKVVWLPALIALALLVRSGIGARRPRAVACSFIGAITAYVMLLSIARHDAATRARDHLATLLPADAPLLRSALLPQPTRPLRWVLVGETAREVVWLEVEAFAGPIRFDRAPNGLDDPRVAAARATRDGKVWESFVRFPWVRVVGEGDEARVLLSDARYWYTDFCTVGVPVN